jgi:hypothetical protein
VPVYSSLWSVAVEGLELLYAKQAEQELVFCALVFGVVLDAVALEVLGHDQCAQPFLLPSIALNR